MITTLGNTSLFVACIVSFSGSLASLIGGIKQDTRWIKRGRIALLLTFLLVTLSTLSLVLLLTTKAYEVGYVFSVTNESTSFLLRLSALWAGQKGSILFWNWLLSIFALAMALRKWDRDYPLFPWVSFIILAVQTFFLFLSTLIENPFGRFWLLEDHTLLLAVFKPIHSTLFIPPDGQGLPPLLHHLAMIFHPPALYLGFIAFIIPFAFALATLISREGKDEWIHSAKNWTLFGWAFLSIGLILGSRWAYDVLGWGGYWNWDPVEVAALLPWLSSTAFLHSIMAQDKNRLFRRWNVFLIMLTFVLVILGTFLTRSGMFASVHAFAESNMGFYFFGLLGVVVIFALGVLLWRWNDLKSDQSLESWFSRESLIFLNTVLFLGIIVICLWGMLAPLVTDILWGTSVRVGPEYYKKAAGPLFGVIVLLMGVAPLVSWGHTNLHKLKRIGLVSLTICLVIIGIVFITGTHHAAALIAMGVIILTALLIITEYGYTVVKFMRETGISFFHSMWQTVFTRRRRYGGQMIHLGVVMIALGIVGIEFFQQQKQATLDINQTMDFAGYTLIFQSLDTDTASEETLQATAKVDVMRNGKLIAILKPQLKTYLRSDETVTLPAVRSTLASDLYILLMEWSDGDNASITLRVYQNPMVNWLWVGGMVLLLGTLVVGWPHANKSR
ncbi:MAG: cytochrome c-type biogenesis CcmF C-terminal domain-containing protein [Anaerolineaceae bacterium]